MDRGPENFRLKGCKCPFPRGMTHLGLVILLCVASPDDEFGEVGPWGLDLYADCFSTDNPHELRNGPPGLITVSEFVGGTAWQGHGGFNNRSDPETLRAQSVRRSLKHSQAVR